jgi:hypothetical protein
VQQIRHKFKIQKVDKMEEKRQRNYNLSYLDISRSFSEKNRLYLDISSSFK